MKHSFVLVSAIVVASSVLSGCQKEFSGQVYSTRDESVKVLDTDGESVAMPTGAAKIKFDGFKSRIEIKTADAKVSIPIPRDVVSSLSDIRSLNIRGADIGQSFDIVSQVTGSRVDLVRVQRDASPGTPGVPYGGGRPVMGQNTSECHAIAYDTVRVRFVESANVTNEIASFETEVMASSQLGYGGGDCR